MTTQDIIKQKSQRPVNFRSYGFKEIDVTGVKVSGYLAAFNNMDEQGDVLLPGCFAKSIQEHGPDSTSFRKIAYLYQHETDEPIGRFTKLVEDNTGLYFEAELDDVELAKQVAVQYQSGTLNQHSIGFKYVWDKIKYDETTQAFIIGEVVLFEGSVVTIGANENTPFLGFKSLDVISESQKLIDQFEAITAKVNKEHPGEAYEMRKIMSKYIALYEMQPGEPLQATESAIDFEKLTKSLTINQPLFQ